jgi:DNA-binding response OmpR family regulator
MKDVWIGLKIRFSQLFKLGFLYNGLMKKILLVEDDQFLRDIYLQMLSSLFEVDTAEAGDIAYDKITKNTYDLILLDMFLPNLDGKQVFEKLELNFQNKYNDKIVFMTNDDSEQTNKYFTEKGIKYFIKSSLNPEEFVTKVKSFLT